MEKIKYYLLLIMQIFNKNNKYNLLCLLFLLIGFLIAYFKNYKGRKNNNYLQELILILENNCYHIHHFITIGLVIIMMIISRHLSKQSFYILVFFLIGISLEDLLYKDWNIIKNNCNKKKLLKFVKNMKDYD